MAISTNGIDRAFEVLFAIHKRTRNRVCRTAAAERGKQEELSILDSRLSWVKEIEWINKGFRPSWSGRLTKIQRQMLGLAKWCSTPTCATFTAITPPNETPDYISKSAQGTSLYWYRIDGLIRQSDHWGKCSESNWDIDDPSKDCGWCDWRSFKTNSK